MPEFHAGVWAVEKSDSLSGPMGNLGACHLGREKRRIQWLQKLSRYD